jgi:hypothetical protein
MDKRDYICDVCGAMLTAAEYVAHSHAPQVSTDHARDEIAPAPEKCFAMATIDGLQCNCTLPMAHRGEHIYDDGIPF